MNFFIFFHKKTDKNKKKIAQYIQNEYLIKVVNNHNKTRSFDMQFKEICKRMRDLLDHITQDLGKAESGNKAASQRVRTGTVKLEKIAKAYRKESIVEEKHGKSTKKSSKGASKKAAPKKAVAKKAAPKKAAPAAVKTKPKAKAQAHKTVAKSHALSFKKPTAKLPAKKKSHR